MKTLLTILCLFALPACGILNLGGVNEDGEPKTVTDARVFLRSSIDASVQVWGTEALRRYQPAILAAFDISQDGILQLAEVEAAVNLEDPQATTQLLVLAITLFQNRPK